MKKYRIHFTTGKPVTVLADQITGTEGWLYFWQDGAWCKACRVEQIRYYEVMR